MSRRPRALVIGGTGPTGPFVVEGLHERGYEVTILHGGQHEYEFAVPGVRHIHEDPHFEETLRRGLGEATFDLVVAQYGRLRVIAEVLAGRAGRLVAVGGATGIFAPDEDPRWGATRKPALFPDTSSVYVDDPGEDGAYKLGYRMVEAMNALFERHVTATYVGYPVNYGPRNPGPYDWSVIRRVLDGRRTFAVADDGLKIDSRVFTANAAAAVLLVVDNPEISAGKRYSVSDENAFSMRQRIDFIVRHLGGELELVDMPYELAWPCHPLWRHHRGHRLATSTLIREELGYRDAVPADEAMATTIEWLLANRPEPGGELERQVGDPFDYAREDDLVERWRASLRSLGAVESPLPVQGHQYRHPKKPGDAWSAGTTAMTDSPVLPLAGVRVVDFTTAMAGPAASMLLADFGAEVIKVEPPEGESSRRWGSARFGDRGDTSGLFLALNRNKASVTVDLKSEEGAAAVERLVRDADVVMESFKPGVADRLGIGYDQLSKLRPELIYVSVSGFGQTGPLREQPGYDQLLQAFSGHMSITGEPDRPSVRIGPSAIDLITGAHAAFGVVLALRVRDQTGAGQHLETSLYDSSLHLISHYIADFTGSGRLPGKIGGSFAFLAPYGMFAARDREIYVGVGTDTMFAKLCVALGAPELVEDPRFATNPERVARRDELDATLAPLFAAGDAATWVETFLGLGIPASIVHDISEVVAQEQALAREMIVETGVEAVRTAGLPLKLSLTPAQIRRPPPSLGADNALLGEARVADAPAD